MGDVVHVGDIGCGRQAVDPTCVASKFPVPVILSFGSSEIRVEIIQDVAE